MTLSNLRQLRPLEPHFGREGMPSRIASDGIVLPSPDRPGINSSLIATRFLGLGIASPQRTVNLHTSGDSPLTAKGRVPRTKEVQGGAREGRDWRDLPCFTMVTEV